MGTTNKTQSNNNLLFNGAAQNLYNQFQQGAGSTMMGYINNPFTNAMYQQGSALSQKGAAAAGQNNMNMLNQNMLAQGMGGQAGAGFLAAQRNQTGRANQAMMGQANTSNVLAALQRQMAASGTGLSYSPQLIGTSGTSNSSTGGAGTWAPQAAGAALGAMTGGIGALGMGALGAMGSFGGGSVGGVSNPGLGSISYMPGGGPSMAAPNPMSLGMGSVMMPNFGMGG